MKAAKAIVLFAHGSRDPQWARPMESLRIRLAQLHPQVQVRVAFFELQQPSLRQELEELALAGVRQIDVVPIFWSSGGHITSDLPVIVGKFVASNPEMDLCVLPVLSELPGIADFLAEAISVEIRQAGRQAP